MRIQKKVDRQIELIADDALAGNYAAAQERAQRLGMEYKIEDTEIDRRVNLEAYKRGTPAKERQYFGASGNMTKSQERKYMRDEEVYGELYPNANQ